jgi:hypothetical protein
MMEQRALWFCHTIYRKGITKYESSMQCAQKKYKMLTICKLKWKIER